MGERCALCQKEKELMDSHIIPNFVIRWLKKSGATPFLRSAEDPDTRIQDYKEPLLCSDCEQILSDWEGKFASRIFYPHIRDESKSYEYEEWLQKFIISVSWRFLEAEKTSLDRLDNSSIAILNKVRDEWKEILLGDSTLLEESREHHLFFLGEVETPAEELPEKWEYYSDRGIDATVVTRGDELHIYFKFPQIVFISCLSPPTIDGLEGTKVDISGSLEVPQKILNQNWGSFLLERARITSNRRASEEEQEKIKERLLKNPEEAIESESFKTHQRNFNRKIESHKSTDYLNEECPVCGVTHLVFENLPHRPITQDGVSALEKSENIYRAEGIYPFDGSQFINSEGEKFTGAIILSKRNCTYLINLYTETGWVVDREFPHGKEMSEDELDEFIDMLLEEFDDYYQKKYSP